MIVIQGYDFEECSTREPKVVRRPDRGSTSPSADAQPLSMISLTGKNLSGRHIQWIISEGHIRSLSFPGWKLVIRRQTVERFIVSFAAPDVFSLWLRNTSDFPSRLRSPAAFDRDGSQRSQKSSSSEVVLPVQNMEIGSFFGTVPQRKLVAGLRHLEYRVDECSWDEFFSWSPANG